MFPFQTANDDVTLHGRVAYLPVGSYAQHGGFLPLDTDTLIAKMVAVRLAEQIPGLVLPVVGVSVSHEYAGWRGTVAVPASVLASYVTAIMEDVYRQGFSWLIVVSGGGGNHVLKDIVQEANRDTRRAILFPSTEAVAEAYEFAELETSPSEDLHAGEYETSLGLFAGFVGGDMLPLGKGTARNWTESYAGLREFNEDGFIGVPSLGTVEKGRKILTSYERSYLRVMEILLIASG